MLILNTQYIPASLAYPIPPVQIFHVNHLPGFWTVMNLPNFLTIFITFSCPLLPPTGVSQSPGVTQGLIEFPMLGPLGPAYGGVWSDRRESHKSSVDPSLGLNGRPGGQKSGRLCLDPTNHQIPPQPGAPESACSESCAFLSNSVCPCTLSCFPDCLVDFVRPVK